MANEHTKQRKPVDIYPLTTIEEILKWCQAEGKTFWEYVEDYEGHDIWEFSPRYGRRCAKPSNAD